MNIVLVTGADGQLGKCIKDIISKNSEQSVLNGVNGSIVKTSNDDYIFFFFANKEILDITSESNIQRIIGEIRPDIIVNCAAFVNTVAAESDPEIAYLVNTDGPGLLAKACAENGIRLIHVSTDFVFDGESNSPYKESDGNKPINVYGLTKYFGELAVRKTLQDCIIIRTSWLYSEYGNNFVTKTISALNDGKEHKFVYDQISRPTYAGNLAKFIFKMCKEIPNENNTKTKIRGIYHFTDSGIASRYDFAKAIEEYYYGEEHNNVTECSIDDFTDTIRRPRFSVLGRTRVYFPEYEFEYWRHALKRCIEKIKEKQDV